MGGKERGKGCGLGFASVKPCVFFELFSVAFRAKKRVAFMGCKALAAFAFDADLSHP